MADFPRTLLPEQISDLFSPGALKQLSHSGIIQIRATKAVGWSWSEAWGLLRISNTDHNTLRAFIKRAWNRGEIYDVTHPLVPGSGRAPNGLGTAGVLVDGAAQVGDTLLTDAWPINTPNCVRAEDAIKIAGDNAVYIVTADTASNGSGEVDIPISPPLRISPADGGAITTTGVKFRATLLSRSRFEGSRPPLYYAGLTVVMTEALI